VRLEGAIGKQGGMVTGGGKKISRWKMKRQGGEGGTFAEYPEGSGVIEHRPSRVQSGGSTGGIKYWIKRTSAENK